MNPHVREIFGQGSRARNSSHENHPTTAAEQFVRDVTDPANEGATMWDIIPSYFRKLPHVVCTGCPDLEHN